MTIPDSPAELVEDEIHRKHGYWQEALDALEGMVEQHFLARRDGTLDDEGLSANELAATILLHRRPERWTRVDGGIQYNEGWARG